jgi:hypothetical protein
MSDPQDIKVLTFKRDGILILVHFALYAAVVLAMLTHFHGLDVATGIIILGALQVPGLVGVKTLPGVVAAIVAEMQRQFTVHTEAVSVTKTETTPERSTTTTSVTAQVTDAGTSPQTADTTPELPHVPNTLPPPPLT